MNLRLAIWESFVLWFFGSKIKDSYASEVVRQVLSARCNLLPVGFEMTDDDFGNEQAMMPNAAKSIEWPKPTLSELMTLLVWKDMKRHDMCFFMFFHAFCQMLGGYLRRISAKAGKLPNLPRKLLCPFALPGSCVQSSKQRSPEKHECFTKVSSNPLLPMICPIKRISFPTPKSMVSVLCSGFPPLQGLPNSRTANWSHQLGKMGKMTASPVGGRSQTCKDMVRRQRCQIFFTSDLKWV